MSESPRHVLAHETLAERRGSRQSVDVGAVADEYE